MLSNKFLIVELLGISGSGKSFYFKAIKNSLVNNENTEKNQKVFFKNKNFVNFMIFILYEIVSIPHNIYLLLSIFDYFIDNQHKTNIKFLIKRFIKIYKVYLSSKMRFIFLNKIYIHESIVHLSINLNNKEPIKFLNTIKKLYKTKNIVFLYLDISLDMSLERMVKRGDKLKNFYFLRKRRYELATIFHKNLLKEIKNINNPKINVSNLIINSESSPKENIIEIQKWLSKLQLSN